MSWTDVFPVLSDEQVAEYQMKVTPEEVAMLEDWCGVGRVINPQAGRHLVAATLFWKNETEWHEPAWQGAELPAITRELMRDARKLGLVTRFAPWDHYVQPLLDGAAALRQARPDIVFRVYLAADLEFLVPDLVEAGCEVFLMRGSSILHNPGAMWRFLAMEEEGRWVTITDADRVPSVLHDVDRTERILGSGLGLWRMPYQFVVDRNKDHPGFYRTMNACHFGVAGGYPVGLLMRAFLWHTVRGTMPDECTVGIGEKQVKLTMFGSGWPRYGFDEWFLTAAMYPRLAFGGVATFFPASPRAFDLSHWFVLDIEYVTWANPKSEVIYFGESSFARNQRPKENDAPPESPILSRMLQEKAAGRVRQEAAIEPGGEQGRLTLVVARYSEDIGWVAKAPSDVTVVVYNKGKEITDPTTLARVDHLIPLPNVGREADTYLHHLQTYKHGHDEEWTVFTQGDPFPHSPGFLELLRNRDAWADVQALTSHYSSGVTPPYLVTALQDREWVRGIPVRSEICSARSLGNMSWQDGEAGYRMFSDYSEYHRIPSGWSLSWHFLESCGLPELAERAWRAVMVRYAYAAIFAVRNERISLIPKDCIPRMRKLACDHYSGGYVYERMWLHLFGQPFVTEDNLSEMEQSLVAKNSRIQ